jgi:hypothetical protein
MEKALWAIAAEIESLPLSEAVALLNEVRLILHHVSPFKSEPVDFVRWVLAETVYSNDYNPNSVAPPRDGTLGPFHPH